VAPGWHLVPTLVGAAEGGGFGVAEQLSDLRHRHLRPENIAFRRFATRGVDEAAEAGFGNPA